MVSLLGLGTREGRFREVRVSSDRVIGSGGKQKREETKEM